MRLNNDCIRDILLYLEENITYDISCIRFDSLSSSLNSYTPDTLRYHINQLYNAGLIDKPEYWDDGPQILNDLTWEGHQFVNDIRDDKVWRSIKEKCNSIKSVSMPFLVSMAPTVLEKLIK